MSTLVTSMLSSAQPVTAIAPAMPDVPLAGVSKLPTGDPGVLAAPLTCACSDGLVARGAPTVITPLGPELTVTWKAPLPVPDPGDTVIAGWFEEAVQATPGPSK